MLSSKTLKFLCKPQRAKPRCTRPSPNQTHDHTKTPYPRLQLSSRNPVYPKPSAGKPSSLQPQCPKALAPLPWPAQAGPCVCKVPLYGIHMLPLKPPLDQRFGGYKISLMRTKASQRTRHPDRASWSPEDGLV